MGEDVKHEQYKGHDIRSAPINTEQGWKIIIDITLPPINFEQHGQEFLKELVFPSLDEAHQGGFEYARQIIDERERS